MGRYGRQGRLLFALLLCAAPAGAVNEAWQQPARYAFEYRVDLSTLSAPRPQQLRVWIPYPAETADQTLLAADIQSSWPHRLTRDARGNQMVYLEGAGLPDKPVVLRFVAERRPSGGTPTSAIAPDSSLDPQRYLNAPQLIPLAGVIRQIAEQESRGRQTDEQKMRAFYDYVVRTMRYSKDGTGWGRGDAIWACTNQRGNCTDFHSLFIGLALSEHIPARFIIGFPIPSATDTGDVPGYHCWAEYYDRGRGWVPVDASEAKKSGWHDAYFGALPNDRIQFTVGRDLHLEPPQAGPPLNYFIYPYAEADGVPLANVPAHFHFQRQRVTTAQR